MPVTFKLICTSQDLWVFSVVKGCMMKWVENLTHKLVSLEFVVLFVLFELLIA